MPTPFTSLTHLPELHHHVAGPDGAPWVTFIPGIGNDASFWHVQAQALASQFRVLSFDPWGHADSPEPPEPCHFADVQAGVIQLWDRLGIARSSVVGLGFGGSVALSLGLDFPARLERIVACCCRPRQPDDRRDFWRQRQAVARQQGLAGLVTATVDRWLAPEFRAAHPAVDASLRAMMGRTSVAGYCAYVGAFIEMDFSERLSQLNVPTLLIAAEHDHGGGPVDDMRQMAAQIPGARLEVVAGVGHIVNHEAPDAVTRLLRDHLKSS